jgi:peptide chain release factor 1
MDLLKFKKNIEEKLQLTEKMLGDSEVISDLEKLQKLGMEHKTLTDLSNLYNTYETKLSDIEEINQLYNANELEEEEYTTMIDETERSINKLKKEIIYYIVPKSEYDERNILMEIRSGAGGDEAALFASELMRMYIRYAEIKNWKYETIDLTENELGGIKTAVLKIKGEKIFEKLKYESGVHRVQRVPQTESSGRVHTSTATVAVLPEVNDIDVEINDSDLKIDTYRAGGAGGQHVNKTDSAVRITHLPTGIVVASQNSRSQHQNKDVAMNVLRTKIFELKFEKQQRDFSDARKSQVGTGDRSEKIRTYNFPQNRVTDHRIHYTSHRINEIMDGDIDEFINALTETDLMKKIEKLEL